jgi:hypothetical protein
MQIADFSNGFDTLVNAYANSAAFGEDVSVRDIRVDEFEKSQFLTKAQEAYVLSLYNGKNPYGESFESTEEIRRYLSNLVEEKKLKPITTSDGKPLGMESNSKFFTLPENLWFITYESAHVSDAKCDNMSTLDVYPVTQDEYHKIKRNPFRGANDRRALRLDLSEGNIEVISKYTVTEYYIRYLRKIKPILLVNLTNDDVNLEGYTTPQGCELHESLHQRILELAVQMALQSKGYNIKNENK